MASDADLLNESACDFLNRILLILAARAAEGAAYESWSDEFARKQTRSVWTNSPDLWYKKIDRKLAVVELQQMKPSELDTLGFGRFTLDDGRIIRLIPLWAWNFIDTSVLIDIFGIERKDTNKDLDNRGGCTAFGFEV